MEKVVNKSSVAIGSKDVSVKNAQFPKKIVDSPRISLIQDGNITVNGEKLVHLQNEDIVAENVSYVVLETSVSQNLQNVDSADLRLQDLTKLNVPGNELDSMERENNVVDMYVVVLERNALKSLHVKFLAFLMDSQSRDVVHTSVLGKSMALHQRDVVVVRL